MTKFATIETNKGTIRAELYDKDAPKTVANFEKLSNSGFYDGTKFHPLRLSTLSTPVPLGR